MKMFQVERVAQTEPRTILPSANTTKRGSCQPNVMQQIVWMFIMNAVITNHQNKTSKMIQDSSAEQIWVAAN